MAEEKSWIGDELVANVRAVLEKRENASDGLVLNERVDVVLEGEGNGPFRVTKGPFEFVVDEPPLRGGTDVAPNPLAFFIGGAATCFLSHLMMQMIAKELRVEALQMVARGRFDRRAVGGHLTRLVYDVEVATRASSDAVAEAAQLAEKMCYGHNTLVKAGVEIITDVSCNGERILSLVADTTHI